MKFEDRKLDPMDKQETEFFLRQMVHPKLHNLEQLLGIGLAHPDNVAQLERPWRMSYVCGSCENVHQIVGPINDISAAAAYMMLGNSREIRILPMDN